MCQWIVSFFCMCQRMTSFLKNSLLTGFIWGNMKIMASENSFDVKSIYWLVFEVASKRFQTVWIKLRKIEEIFTIFRLKNSIEKHHLRVLNFWFFVLLYCTALHGSTPKTRWLYYLVYSLMPLQFYEAFTQWCFCNSLNSHRTPKVAEGISEENKKKLPDKIHQ